VNGRAIIEPKPDFSEVEQPPRPKSPRVRSARPRDVDDIVRLVNAWADEGLTLRRSREEVERTFGEFVVAEIEVDGGWRVIATGCLEVHSPAIAEIRSVAVDPAAKGSGAGREVVQFLLEQARALDLDEVTLLTKIPAFFGKYGFRAVTPEELPSGFIDEAIAARGRTLIGRTIMLRGV